MRYGSIIPLIGGMTIGNQLATGNKPEVLYSYSDFGNHDKNLNEYYNNSIEYIDLNKSKKIIENLDFVSSTCPCAGLSMANTSNRGADAKQNDWMYKSTEFVLSSLKPKVMFGENAPGLYTKMGKPVLEKLRDIGEKYGYSFSAIKTSTILHGIPQNRIRTFYFFWKSEKAPILTYYNRKYEDIISFLHKRKNNNKQNLVLSQNPVSWFLPYKFLLNKLDIEHKEFQKIYNNFDNVTVGLIKLNLLEDLIEWLENNYPDVKIHPNGKNTFLSVYKHIKNKIDNGKGWWDPSPHFVKNGKINALIYKNASRLVHPIEERFFSIDELYHLMGLPGDFKLYDSKNINHIFQNVPVTTARDWTYEVMKFINGELKLSNSSFIKQNNIKRIVDYEE